MVYKIGVTGNGRNQCWLIVMSFILFLPGEI